MANHMLIVDQHSSKDHCYVAVVGLVLIYSVFLAILQARNQRMYIRQCGFKLV